MTVEFKFEIDQKVKTCFGDIGIVRGLSLDDTNGKTYWVIRNQESMWFKETDISEVA